MLNFKNKDLEVPFPNYLRSNPNITLKTTLCLPKVVKATLIELNNYDENNKPSLTVDNATGNETDGYKVTFR